MKFMEYAMKQKVKGGQGPRGSSQNFRIFFIIGTILLKFSHNM